MILIKSTFCIINFNRFFWFINYFFVSAAENLTSYESEKPGSPEKSRGDSFSFAKKPKASAVTFQENKHLQTKIYSIENVCSVIISLIIWFSVATAAISVSNAARFPSAVWFVES